MMARQSAQTLCCGGPSDVETLVGSLELIVVEVVVVVAAEVTVLLGSTI